jgi:hypothetical protein
MSAPPGDRRAAVRFSLQFIEINEMGAPAPGSPPRPATRRRHYTVNFARKRGFSRGIRGAWIFFDI